jgi:cysteine desulfurase
MPLGTDGRLDLDTGLATPGGGAVVLATTLVCGQTGIVEDMAAVADAVARTPGLSVHVDATQAVAYEDVDLTQLPAATLTVAPHKFGGPRGIGGLLVRGDVTLVPVVPGPQEAGLRGGTEAVVLAAGFAAALGLAVAERQAEAARVAGLRARLEEVARAAAADAGIETVVIGSAGRRASHIATIAFPGIDRQALVMAADLEGVCCATGTACASGSSEPAPALGAAGLPEAVCAAAVRLSIGRGTGVEDVERAGERLRRVLRRIVAAGGDGNAD